MSASIEKQQPIIESMQQLGKTLLAEKLYTMRVNLEQEPIQFEFNVKRHPLKGRHIPGILMITLPKTGSDYIWSCLFDGLSVAQKRVSSASFPDDIVAAHEVEQLAKGNAVAHGHIPARPLNLNIIQLYLDRLVVHVRDPRQAVLSWLYFADEYYQAHGPVFSALQDPALHPDYFNWSFEEKMHWYIKGHFNHWVNWIDQWLQAEADPQFQPKILLTEFKKMKQDPEAFFNDILDFYDIDRSYFSIELKRPLQPGQLHFRKGMLDEWQEVFSTELIEFTSQCIPNEMKQRFGWVG